MDDPVYNAVCRMIDRAPDTKDGFPRVLTVDNGMPDNIVFLTPLLVIMNEREYHDFSRRYIANNRNLGATT